MSRKGGDGMAIIESETVEFKSEVVPDICKEIIAFANTKGGTLYIGVADDGTVVGVAEPDFVIRQVSNKIRDSIVPDVTMFVGYDVKTVQGKAIVVVTIEKGTGRPYYLASKGLRPLGVFVRNGTSSDPATDTAIRKMIKETDGDGFESLRSMEQSLTFETASRHFAGRNIPFDNSKMQTMGMVSADGMYMNVGLLLSDQCTHSIKVATFSDREKGEFQDRQEFTGSVLKQMEDVYAYLELRNQTKSSISGLYRTDLRDYPDEAIREALLNCIVHRDYAYSASTLVSVYSDRIEFVSVGGLPEGVEMEDILLGLSVCRNPKLAGVYYRLSLIEAYGTGIPKIMNAYAHCKRKPKLEATNNAFKITLPNCNYDEIQTVVPKEKNAEENRIKKIIRENGSVSRKDVESILGVSRATATRMLNKMIQTGEIFPEGNGKKKCYVMD